MPTRRSAVVCLVVGVLGLVLPLLVRAQGDVDLRKPVWAYAITPEMRVADVRGTQPQPSWFTAGPKALPQPPAAAGRRAAGPPDTQLYTLPGSKFQFTM